MEKEQLEADNKALEATLTERVSRVGGGVVCLCPVLRTTGPWKCVHRHTCVCV